MAKRNVEDIKRESRHLRGAIAEELAKGTTHFGEDELQLLKFHGSYQQDDRDVRKDRQKAGQERAFSMMVRSKIPGGRLTPEQWLVHDRCADELGNGTIRITSRQGFQLHGVLKGNLKSHIRRISESGLTTWGACGDVVRNVMATPVPLDTPAHRDTQALAREISEAFASESRAHSEIWLDGEKITDEPEVEPLYGEVYLPRKFKFGIAIPPRNDVDILTHDIGLVPHAPDGEVQGYTVFVGGGMGMTHGKTETHPALAQPLLFAARGDVVAICRAIVTVQRDHGDRENRKRARMKYLIETRGLDWFRGEVMSRVEGVEVSDPKPVTWETVEDPLGWHEQGDGRLFLGVWVEEGRIADKGARRWKSALRAICERFEFPIRLTPNCNIILHDIGPAQRAEVDALLAEHGIPDPDQLTRLRQMAMACVALPTCGLALAESERALPGVLDRIEEVMRDLGLADEPILIRMTGCPNGCARPYNADIAFVGRSPEKYAMFVGGSADGCRLAGLHTHTVKADEIPGAVRALLEEFRANRSAGETFSAWWCRTQTSGEAPHPEQFHVELTKRSGN
jgi:sulfite reductase beta subunit-like hemoprotein